MRLLLGAVPLWGSFRVRVGFLFVIISDMSATSKHLFFIVTLSWMEVTFLSWIHVCHPGIAFSNLILSWVLLWVKWNVFSTSVLLRVILCLFYVVYLLSFSVMFISFQYIARTFFCFLFMWLLVRVHTFSVYFLVVFYSLFL